MTGARRPYLKVVVVGQATGRVGGKPWNGNTPSSKRLYRWLGVADYGEFMACYRPFNIGRYAGKEGKGDAYVVDPASVLAIMVAVSDADLVLLVGKAAQRAVFGEMEKVTWKHGKYCGVPHPSGINMQLNHGGELRVMRVVRRWVREAARSLR